MPYSTLSPGQGLWIGPQSAYKGVRLQCFLSKNLTLLIGRILCIFYAQKLQYPGVVDFFSTGVNDTGSKFAAGVVDTGGNLPPVSLTPVANNGNNIRLQTTWKWTWRQKFIYMFPLLPKGEETKLLKFFLLKIFSICHRCRWHQWQTLSCQNLREFSKNFETVLTEYSGAGGNLIHEKNQKQKTGDTVPLIVWCRWWCRWYRRQFATGVNDTGGEPWLANISANFRKNSKLSKCYFKGLGGRWFLKKTWSKKSRDTVPLTVRYIEEESGQHEEFFSQEVTKLSFWMLICLVVAAHSCLSLIKAKESLLPW